MTGFRRKTMQNHPRAIEPIICQMIAPEPGSYERLAFRTPFVHAASASLAVIKE
jgi:hypothetical protein